jgi:hypothetical protein
VGIAVSRLTPDPTGAQHQLAYSSFTFSDSYAAGGDAVPPGIFGFTTVEAVFATTGSGAAGTVFAAYDASTKKLSAFLVDPSAAAIDSSDATAALHSGGVTLTSATVDTTAADVATHIDGTETVTDLAVDLGGSFAVSGITFGEVADAVDLSDVTVVLLAIGH